MSIHMFCSFTSNSNYIKRWFSKIFPITSASSQTRSSWPIAHAWRQDHLRQSNFTTACLGYQPTNMDKHGDFSYNSGCLANKNGGFTNKYGDLSNKHGEVTGTYSDSIILIIKKCDFIRFNHGTLWLNQLQCQFHQKEPDKQLDSSIFYSQIMIEEDLFRLEGHTFEDERFLILGDWGDDPFHKYRNWKTTKLGH